GLGGIQVLAQANHRLAGPGVLDLVLATVAAGVVGGGVVVQAVGHELDHAAALALARALVGAAHRLEHGDEVVAVHLQAVQAAGQALLGQGPGAGLRSAPDRDRPAVVDHAQDQRELVGPSGIHRGVEVGLRGTAVAAAGDRDPVLLAQLEAERGAGGHQALGGDRHAPRVVVPGPLEVVAALVAAPVHQHLARAHAAHELG